MANDEQVVILGPSAATGRKLTVTTLGIEDETWWSSQGQRGQRESVPLRSKAGSLVAWMARRKETASLKPIDTVIGGMMTSPQAVAQANAEVAP
jgi:hypothetical protein